MNAKGKVSILFNAILYITIGSAVVGTTDWNIFAMSTVVWTPASVTTVEKVSLWSSTRYIIKPDLSCSHTVSMSHCVAKPVKMCKQTTSYLKQTLSCLKSILKSEADNNNHHPSYWLQTHNELSLSTTRMKSPPDMSRTSWVRWYATQTAFQTWIITGCDGRSLNTFVGAVSVL